MYIYSFMTVEFYLVEGYENRFDQQQQKKLGLGVPVYKIHKHEMETMWHVRL